MSDVKSHVLATLAAAKTEVQNLIAERQRIDVRITQLSAVIRSLSPLCDEAIPSYVQTSLRLTDHCYAVVGRCRAGGIPKRREGNTDCQQLRTGTVYQRTGEHPHSIKEVGAVEANSENRQ